MTKKDLKIIGIIPARGGSKLIPGKNIKPLLGKPLIAYTIEVALEAGCLDRIIVSTDDGKIAEIAKEYGAEVPFIRPTSLALDSTPMLPVLQHAIEYLQKEEDYSPDVIVLLQPTSPLRKVGHIKEALEIFLERDVDSVISINEIRQRFGKFHQGVFESYFEEGLGRKDVEPFYYENGLIYVSKVENIVKRGSLYGQKIGAFIVEEGVSIDTDTPFEFQLAELMLKRYQEGQ